jgi:putative membrane protein
LHGSPTGPADHEARETYDATRRTHLATERTQLAWWRTGLTALAVALAVGRLIPEIADSAHRWPYTIVGVAFAVYGVALIAYGTARARSVDDAVARGEFARSQDRVLAALTFAGVGLGLATIALIAAG